jgi:hypothetical protein
MSDFIYTNGSTVAGSKPTATAVPEPATIVSLSALLAPVGVMVVRRRQRGTATSFLPVL